jgi:hypothetical protein
MSGFDPLRPLRQRLMTFSVGGAAKMSGRAGSAFKAAYFAALVVLPAAARAGDDSERIAERVHSNLPLYNYRWRDMWPRGFTSEESFGCTSRVAFGDWRFVPAQAEESDEGHWERFSNYGVFHCAAVMRSAGTRADLEDAQWEHGFFVRLGEVRLRSVEWELWALQRGMVPGSDYTLLAREAGPAALIEEFRVLQQRCPRGRILESSGMDVWSTRYCAVNSRDELFSLARRMLRLPPMGTIARVADPDHPSDQ